MGKSVTIVSLVNPLKERFQTKFEVHETQDRNLNDFIPTGLQSPKSIVELREKAGDLYSFNVTHSARETKKDIFVYINNLINSDFEPLQQVNKFQETAKFSFDLNFSTKEMFVYAKTEFAKSFVKRLENNNYIEINSNDTFNLLNIKNHPNVQNVWGIWEKTVGDCSKMGYFGLNVAEHEGINPEQVTSVNFNYRQQNGDSLTITLSKENRISTISKGITSKELLKVYNELKTHFFT